MNLLTEILDTPEKRREYFLQQSIKVRFREFEIWQYVPNSLLKYFSERINELEPELLNWIDSLPQGATFYDLGASTGLYSMYASMHGLNTFSFEPDVLNYSILEVNHFLNNSLLKGKLHSCNLAVSNTSKLSEMHTGRFQYGAHNKILGKAEVREGGQFYQPEHIQSVLQVSLSEAVHNFGFTPPDYIKVDIDGAELMAFQGMGELLQDVKSIFVEISENNSDTPKLMELLHEAGFKEVSRNGVLKPDGGCYEGLFNIVLDR